MILSEYFANHGVIEYIYDNPEDIQDWLGAIPSPVSFEFLMYAFPLAEQSKLFQIRDVADWYGKLCQKITNNLDIEVIGLGMTTIQRRNKVKEYLGLFIKELVTMALFDVDMQSLMNNFMKRSSFALQILLVLLVADEVLTEPTLTKLQIELTPQPRWQSLGLEALPTLGEIIELL
jgi:hypothetical protein